MQSRGDVPGTFALDPVMVRVILMHCKKLRHIWPRGLRLLLEEGFEEPFLTECRDSWGDKVQYAAGAAEVGVGDTILNIHDSRAILHTAPSLEPRVGVSYMRCQKERSYRKDMSL